MSYVVKHVRQNYNYKNTRGGNIVQRHIFVKHVAGKYALDLLNLIFFVQKNLVKLTNTNVVMLI